MSQPMAFLLFSLRRHVQLRAFSQTQRQSELSIYYILNAFVVCLRQCGMDRNLDAPPRCCKVTIVQGELRNGRLQGSLNEGRLSLILQTSSGAFNYAS